MINDKLTPNVCPIWCVLRCCLEWQEMQAFPEYHDLLTAQGLRHIKHWGEGQVHRLSYVVLASAFQLAYE